MRAAHAVSLLVDRELVTLDRAVGALRRRNLAIDSLAIGPAQAPGLSRVTVILTADLATVETTVKKLHRLSGIRGAVTFPVDRAVAGEIALVRVRAGPEPSAGLRHVIALFKADIIDEGPDSVIVQAAGAPSFIQAFIRAIEEFDILEIARSGSVALARAAE